MGPSNNASLPPSITRWNVYNKERERLIMVLVAALILMVPLTYLSPETQLSRFRREEIKAHRASNATLGVRISVNYKAYYLLKLTGGISLSNWLWLRLALPGDLVGCTQQRPSQD
jgi:hypothetical protein